MKENIVILTGSGFNYSWHNGKCGTSQTIKKIILEDKTFGQLLFNNTTFQFIINGDSFGKWLLKLASIKLNKSEEDINFEEILNCIDKLYSGEYNEVIFLSKSYIKALQKSGVDIEYIQNTIPNVDLFLLHMYRHYCDLIIMDVKKYSENSNFYENDLEFNKNVSLFFEKISSNFNIKYFTLNYDTLLLKVLKKGFLCDGIEKNKLKNYRGIYQKSDDYFDIKKILISEHIHINLHGSIYDNYNNDTIYRCEKFKNNAQEEITQDDRGIIIGNILTSMNKQDKIHVNGFSDLNSLFSKYMLESENLIIIGYSCSDIYINTLIKNFLKRGGKVFYIDFHPLYCNKSGWSNNIGYFSNRDSHTFNLYTINKLGNYFTSYNAAMYYGGFTNFINSNKDDFYNFFNI